MTASRTSDTPISAVEFATSLAALGLSEMVEPVVACSGGPDSIALAVLARDWAGNAGRRVHTITVDHGLRPEASEEAERVGRTLRNSGIEAEVLHYTGPSPKRDIQAAARQIRYRLIGDWMSARGLTDLLLAHHRDDQAETVLLRLSRGSGVDGLSAMSAITDRDGIRLLRPLLHMPKARLEATAVRSGLTIVRDPSNANQSFARVRMRALKDVLAAEGMTPERLAATAARMNRARSALEAARNRFLKDHSAPHAAGFLSFDPGAFADLPEDVALRVLSHAVRILGGRDHPPRETYLTALHTAIAEDGLRGGRTLAGARVMPWRGRILICREFAGVANPVAVADKSVWDSRFLCRIDECDPKEAILGALGRDGLAAVRDAVPAAVASLPGAVRPTLPALRRGSRIVSVPHLNLWDADAPAGSIEFRTVSEAWGDDFRRSLPFSKPVVRPM